MGETFLWLNGYQWAVLAAGLSAIFGGIGSCIGITSAAKLSAGVLSEDPEKFGGLLVLSILPGTQGIYGFITAVLVVVFFGLLGGAGRDIVLAQGLRIFLACLPVMAMCLISAIFQGIVSTAGVGLVAKRGEEAGKGMVLSALVETYAVLSLIVSLFLLMSVKAG
ncbi:MAG TPA: V-type ATP synthase subunit K [Actinobacteria bacterium]|nr:V-type ATP synthase subunit K [Actinomycetota bacterium]